MYEKLTLKQAGTLTNFLNQATTRINNDGTIQAKLYEQVIDIIKAVSPKDLEQNQVVHVPGERRWCSHALSEMIPAVTGPLGAHCYGSGASALGLGSRDLRAAYAIVLYRVLVASHLEVTFQRKAVIWPEAPDAWKQLLDYLNNKARSRHEVNRLIGTINLPPINVEPKPVGSVGVAHEVKLPDEYKPAIMGLSTSNDSFERFQKYRELQDELSGRMLEALKQPDVSVHELNAIRQAQLSLKHEHMVTAYGGKTRVSRPTFDHQYPSFKTDGIHPSPEAIMQSLYKGKDNMSLGVPISPFNFNKPAIESIQFVYGISVKELTLDRVTNLLTDRQSEVDRLKALPHKPEVIKNKIRVLKDEIADILALANELFPVAE